MSPVSRRISDGSTPKVRFGAARGRSGRGWVGLAAVAAVAAGLLCGGVGAQAQTAHFSGAVSAIGGGFSGPYGVAVDSKGDVFVADSSQKVVKEIVAVGGVVSSSSTVNTVGSGFSEPFGVAVDSSGDVFVADEINNAVKEIVAVGGVVSSSSTVNTIGGGFRYPKSVALDSSGDVFVADAGNNAMKEIVCGWGCGVLHFRGEHDRQRLQQPPWRGGG